MTLGLALSGGGAKGAAHIGVLQALKEENININYISGCSSGSIIATLYACGYNPYDILTIFNYYCKHITDYDRTLPFKLFKTVFTGELGIKGAVKGNNLECIVRKYCSKKGISNIDQVKMPLAVPTVDIVTGEIIYYTNTEISEESLLIDNDVFDDIPSYMNTGDMAGIVRASCSFPGVFIPKVLDNRTLVDGGVRVNTPVEILRQMGADKVLAIGFHSKKQNRNQINNIIDITIQSFDILTHQVNAVEEGKADLILRPQLPDISLLECDKNTYIANQGYKLIKANIDKIRELM